MATKKFIIEVDELNQPLTSGYCPDNCKGCDILTSAFPCDKYNLATMKIREMEEEK